MPNFRRFLTRRWVYGFPAAVLAVSFGLAMLHPYPRQSLFGPTIRGEPWCVWEEEVRLAVHGRERSWFNDALEKIGLIKPWDGVLPDFERGGLLPLHLHMADDRDREVRRFALGCLLALQPKHESECEPAFRHHLQDDDAHSRMLAAIGVWRTSKEIGLKSVALPLLDGRDERARKNAAWLLGEMAEIDPDLFAPLANLAEDSDSHVRDAAIRSMRHFGKRGVPILAKALQDGDKVIRWDAVGATVALGKDAEQLLPILLSMRDDLDPSVVRQVNHGLYILDPKRFPKPATWVD